MNHYYENIQGWFSSRDKIVYEQAVNLFHDNSIFVEVGSFKGRSSVAMAVEIINSGKDIKFYCVDTWQGSEEHQGGQLFEDSDVVNKNLYNVFIKNIEPVKNIITPIQKKSEDASKDFENNSLSFVFIDASHDYDNVRNDINSWFPKIKKGGILAGHDAHHEPVMRAVYEFANEQNLKVLVDSCWQIQLN